MRAFGIFTISVGPLSARKEWDARCGTGLICTPAEGIPADVSPLLAMTPALLGQQRFSFHPSVRLIWSAHPAPAIWPAH